MLKFKRSFAKKGVTRFMKKYLEKAKQAGLSVWGKVKNSLNSVWNFVVHHAHCFYTAAVVSLVFGVALFFAKLEHAEQLKEMEKDTLVLVSEFELAIQEHEELIDFHVEINQKLGQELNKAGMMINMQKQVIQQLVYELQKAGVIPKPPTEPQRDPSLAI